MVHCNADDYKTFVRQWLERLSPPVIAQLKTLKSCRFHPRVGKLKVIVFPAGLAGRLPVKTFLVDGCNNQVLHGNGTFPMGLVEDVEHVVPPDEAEVTARCNEAGVETVEVELQTLIEWFADCWVAAGGSDFPLPAYIGVRGDIESFDLKRRQWAPDP